MKVELQTKLFERYPLTLRKPGEGGEEEDNPGANRPGPLDFWGIECGDGWFELLDRMLADFEKHNQKLRKQGKTKGQWPRVLQIKEKFGSLRVYIEPYQASRPSFIRPWWQRSRRRTQPVRCVEARGNSTKTVIYG